MENKLLRIMFLLAHFHLFKAYPLLLQSIVSAERFDWTQLIEYPYEQECLQIVFDGKQRPQLPPMASNTPTYMRSHISLKSRDISDEREGQCETFLVFAESIEMVNHIFQFSLVRQFFPFTNIYLQLENRLNYTAEVTFSIRQFLMNNSVFGYLFEHNDNESNVMVIRDLLRNDMKRKRTSRIRNELSHPMVDTNLVKDDFRISLFNCTPYTIYPQQETEDDK